MKSQISRSYPDATPQATPRPNIRIGNQHPDSLIRLFQVESGGPGAGQGLRVEIEALADKRTCTLSAFQQLGRCLCTTRCCSASRQRCDRCDLLVDLEARACAQVVDGLFIRLPSRPLGVVRIRWGICRRGWCGCWVIAQGHGRVAAEVIDGPRVENSRIRRHNTPPPTPDYEAPPFLPSSRMQRPGLFGLRDVHRWNLRGLPIQPLLSIALVLHAHRPAAPRRGGGPGQRAALTSRLNGRSRRHGHTRRHGHSRHASTDALAATGHTPFTGS